MYIYRRSYIFALIAVILASCTKEAAPVQNELRILATISPEIIVKGGGVKSGETDTLTADHAVLQAWRGDVLSAQAEQSITPGTTRISFDGVKLAGGAEYTIYIWADNDGYYDTRDLRSVSLAQGKNYDGKTPRFDAFYSCSTVICGQDDEMHCVTLKRPFARVNFSAQGALGAHIAFTAPTTLNLKTGKVSGTRSFGYDIPQGDSGVEAFDYVFADEGVSQMDYTFQLAGDEEKTTTIPVSRNTKTNIIYNVTN